MSASQSDDEKAFSNGIILEPPVIEIALSQYAWVNMMTNSAFVSAVNANALVLSDERGPKGGSRYFCPSIEGWQKWRKIYIHRVKTRAVNAAKRAALKSLGVT